MNVYLDNAAARPLAQSTKEYLTSLLDLYGNPNSAHSAGEKARQIISDTRAKTARFINADASDIYFTCGGSASNTLGTRGFCAKNSCYIFYSPTAHKSILNFIQNKTLSHPACPLKVDRGGSLDLKELEYAIAGRKPFVILEYANSEIGTIQDAKAIIELVHFYKGIVYLDCTGSIPAIPLDVQALDADICGFSAHKLGALKGCGVLYKKPDIKLEPLIYGTQEQGLVGGTENVLGIASLGHVIEYHDYSSVSSAGRDHVYRFISRNIPDCYVIGSMENRLPHNLYLCCKGIEGESLAMLLDMNGVQVSTGSACNSGSLYPSAALYAIGISETDIHSCIRMTFSGSETQNELDYVCATFRECVKTLRETNPPHQANVL